jgi:signal transduction histidine kinase/putative methionine-R-sulfoxide reductase with GAF domain
MREDPTVEVSGAEGRGAKATDGALATRVRSGTFTAIGDPHAQLERAVASMSREDLVSLVLGARDALQEQDARFAHMLDIGSALGNALHIDDLLDIIVEKTTELMRAERSSLFLIDESTQELWSKVVQGSVNIEIRLQLGQGIAGWVALTGKSLNIKDAYKDPRFNPKVDESTGYQTRNILCQPIRNLQGHIIGVIQVLNKHAGAFSDEDEYLMSAIASQAAIAIENSKLYLSAIEQNMELIEIKDRLEHKVGELDVLYELERQLGRAQTLEEVVSGVFEKTLDLVHAGAGVLTLAGEPGQSQQAWVVADRGEWKTKWELSHGTLEPRVGVGALAARAREPIVWRAEREAPADDGAVRGAIHELVDALELGLEVENAYALPLMDEGEALGALIVLNTIELDEHGQVGLGPDGVKILSVVAGQLAASIAARRRREEEEKNQRLMSIGQMLSGVLHDFKNPMAIISGYVQLMARADDPEQRATFATSILKQFDQLNQMTRELLAFARGDSNLLIRKIFVHKLMADLKELLVPELDAHGVTLEFDLEYRNEVYIDVAKMKRAILNLARNAAESMSPRGGGVFTVRVWLDEEREQAVFVFKDEGGGIPEDIRDNLFESFVTHGKKNGTGLGLAIVKKMVEDHGGEVSVETETGVGTTFEVRIPQKVKA